MVKRCKHKAKNSGESPTIAKLGEVATRTFRGSGNISKVCRCVNTEDNPDDEEWCCVKWNNYKGYKKIKKEKGTFKFPNKKCKLHHRGSRNRWYMGR